MGELIFGGISRYADRWEEDICELNRKGFSHVELRVDVTDKSSRIYDTEYQKYIRNLLEEKKMTVSVHGNEDIQFGEENSRICDIILDILVEQVIISYNIGADCIVFHLGKYPSKNHGSNKRKRILNAIRLLTALVERTSDYPVKIALETLKYFDIDKGCSFLGDSLDEVYEIMNTVKSERLRIVADIGHMSLHPKTRNDLLLKFNQYKNDIIEIHLHFNDFIKDMHIGLSEDYIKKNTFLFEEIISILQKSKRCVLEMDLNDAEETRTILSKFVVFV